MVLLQQGSKEKPTMQAHVQVYTFNNVQVAAIVCDKEEFNDNIEKLSGIFSINNSRRADERIINDLKKACHLPLCKRGTKTEFLFEKYDVKAEYITMVVRGYGKTLLNNLCNEL